MQISEKSNAKIIEKWLKFPSSHSDQRNRSLNLTHAFFRRFKDLEPMLSFSLSISFPKRAKTAHEIRVQSRRHSV